jgi:hypothetical protein
LEDQDGFGEKAYDDARAPRYSKPEHTDVHDKGSRLMELLQDLVVLLTPKRRGFSNGPFQ